MRFVADMGIALDVARVLRSGGHDVLPLCDEMMRRDASCRAVTMRGSEFPGRYVIRLAASGRPVRGV